MPVLIGNVLQYRPEKESDVRVNVFNVSIIYRTISIEKYVGEGKGNYAVDDVCTSEMCVRHGEHISHTDKGKKTGVFLFQMQYFWASFRCFLWFQVVVVLGM